MSRPTDCPNCGSELSNRMNSTWYKDEVEVVLLCVECPTEWVVTYSNPTVTDVTTTYA